MRAALKKSLATTAALMAMVGLANAGEIDVIADQAKVFRIDEPAFTVIVGNPSIADAVMHDRTTVVVTGKSFGRTNLIILNQDAEPIVDETLVVRADTQSIVTMHKSTARTSYSCNPDCETIMRIGDDSERFSEISGQLDVRNTLAAGGQLASEAVSQ